MKTLLLKLSSIFQEEKFSKKNFQNKKSGDFSPDFLFIQTLQIVFDGFYFFAVQFDRFI
ncbi:PQ-loop domain-containing transporter [Chryseobacterium geocarposphaerae]|uniref:PQ-loop domain-containing transporter n=1 Tax=Chryseobacterium geocarposphaerae TaxID=1416776 RepID=UPI00374226A5